MACPIRIPIAEPRKNSREAVACVVDRLLRFCRKPDEAISAIDTKDVAIALSIGACITLRRAGMRRNPPPTPNSPERVPVINPAPRSFATHRGVGVVT